MDIRPLPGVHLAADLRQLPFAKGSVAEIFSCATLEHFEVWELRLVLRELHRILRPGGILTLGLPDLRSLCRAYLEGRIDFWIMDRYLYGAREHPFDYHRCTPDGPILHQLLRESGFRGIRQEPYDLPFHLAECMMKVVAHRDDGPSYQTSGEGLYRLDCPLERERVYWAYRFEERIRRTEEELRALRRTWNVRLASALSSFWRRALRRLPASKKASDREAEAEA